MVETADPGAVGETPLLELEVDAAPTVYAKAEWFNQATLSYGGGSVKTRIARAMIDAAQASPERIDGRTLIEASSGNTGAAVARFGATRGFDVEIVLPDDAGAGKIAAIEAAGATTTFIDAERGYDAYVGECRAKIHRDSERYCYLNQYENPANPGVHAGTTGVEIWEQTGGTVTHFVAGAGTGGTLTGVSHALGDRGVDVYGFEPATDEHDIAGLKHMHSSGHYVPGTFDADAVETMSFVPTAVAYRYARRLHDRYEERSVRIADPGQWDERFVRDNLRVDGDFVVGPSSGACVARVHRLSDLGVVGAGDVVVVPLPDRGDRYPERDLTVRSTAASMASTSSAPKAIGRSVGSATDST
ncbi:MAG: pyridoxal-phosphate dependent enzyme [Haloferacaceae archaeon]